MIPIATLDVAVNYSLNGRTGYVDFPLTYLTDYFFNLEGFPTTLEGKDFFGRESLKKILHSPLNVTSNFTQEYPFEDLVKSELIKELFGGVRGPGFVSVSKNLDVRPWRSIEKDYERFLVVPQTIRDIYLLSFLDHITSTGFFQAECEKLLECLQNGRAILLLQIPREGGYWQDFGFRSLQSFLQNNHIPPKSVVLLFGQSKPVEQKLQEWYGITAKSFNYFEAFPFEFGFGKENLNSSKLKSYRQECLKQLGVPGKKTFFSHIGNAYADRVTLYSVLNSLFGSVSQVNISNTYNNDLEQCYLEALERLSERREIYVDRVGEETVSIVQKALEEGSRDLPECKIVSPDGTLYTCHSVLTDTYRATSHIELFAETINHDYSEDSDRGADMLHFFTEKTFKPLASMKPFFVFGNKGSLTCLHEMGYQTFSRWWDESYDLEEDTMLRILLIVRELQKISLLSEEELCSMILDMKSTLIHNFDLRISRILDGQKNFENCLKEIYNG